MSETKRQASSAQDLVDLLRLVTIHYYAISGEADETASEPVGDEVKYDTEYGCRLRHDGNEFGARLRTEVNLLNLGRVVVDVAAEYEADEPFDLEQDAAFEFFNEVAVMQLYPYVRETIQSLCVRLFNRSFTLPVTQRGDIAFAPANEPAQPA